MLVGIADQQRAHLARALHGGANLLWNTHGGETHRYARGILVLRAFNAGLVRIEERQILVWRRHLRRLDAARDEELPQIRRGVGSRNEPGDQLARQQLQRRLCDVTNLGVAVTRQHHQQTQLFERTRRDGALGGEQPDVARDLTAPEEIQQRRSQPRVHQ